MSTVPAAASVDNGQRKVGHAFALQVPVAFDSPTKIRDLCALTGNPDAAIYAMRLWDHRQRQSATFTVNDPTGVVERICGWRRKRGVLFGALVSTGLIACDDGTVTIHEWRVVATVEWMGAAGVKQPKRNDPNAAERARSWRANAKRTKGERTANADRTQTERRPNALRTQTERTQDREIPSTYARDTRATGPETGPSTGPEAMKDQEHSSVATDTPAQASLIPEEPATKKPDRDREAEVTRVLTHWRQVHATPASAIEGKAGEKRRARVRSRLAEGTTADECILACDGALKDDWLMGRDPKSTKAYRDVETILRDRAQVERLVGLATGAAHVKASPVAQHAPAVPKPTYFKPEPTPKWSIENATAAARTFASAMHKKPVIKIPHGESIPEGWECPPDCEVAYLPPVEKPVRLQDMFPPSAGSEL